MEIKLTRNEMTNKVIVTLILIMIIGISGVFIYQYIYPPYVPVAVMHQTNEHIASLKNEVAGLQERVKNFDKEVKIKTVVIRTEQAKYVESLPPDDIARGIVDELKLFTDRQ